MSVISLAIKLGRIYRIIFRENGGDYLHQVERIFLRDGLDLRKRLLCAVSTLTTMGMPQHLRLFMEWALIEGINPDEMNEVVLQSYLFAGYPAAIEGFFVLRDVLRSRGLSLQGADVGYRADDWRERGLQLCKQVYGKNFNLLRKNMRELSPELDEWMIVEGYGKVLSRPQLGVVERELCTVAALTVLRKERQLVSHVKGAIAVGATEIEVKEAILQTSIFIGYPATLEALEILDTAITKGSNGP